MGALLATLKKLAVLVVGVPVLLAIANGMGFDSGTGMLLALSFVAGLIFPDLDVLTGLIRTTFKTVLLVIFVILVVVGFPIIWGFASGFCPAGVIHSYLPVVDGLVTCQIILALLAVGVAYGAAELAVIGIPAKDSFHHWTSAILFSGGIALVAKILQLTEQSNVVGAGFGIGYLSHMAADMGKNKGDDSELMAKFGGKGKRK